MPSRRGSPSRSKIAPLKKPVLHGYAAPWYRESEEQHPHTCVYCGGDLKPPEDEQDWFICLGCLHTDRDAELEYDRRLALSAAKAKVAKFKPRLRAEKATASA